MSTIAGLTRTPHRRDSASLLFMVLVVAGAALLVVGWAVSSANRLARADQELRTRWSQVRTISQRRVELVPELVESVQSAVPGEVEVFTQVGEARAQVEQLPGLANALENPADFRRFEDAQQRLTLALQRLLALSRVHPELDSIARFRDLRALLQGNEDRAALERLRFNEAARAFNVLRSRFPTVLVARGLGAEFGKKPLFEVTPPAHDAPAARL